MQNYIIFLNIPHYKLKNFIILPLSWNSCRERRRAEGAWGLFHFFDFEF